MLATLVIGIGAGVAEAHRLKAFATVEGSTVSGSAYFAGMGAAGGVDVKVLAPDGSLVAETSTDDQGRFMVLVRQRTDYRVVVDSGDGHRAEFVVRATEFPEWLPMPGGDSSIAAPASVVAAQTTAAPSPTALELEAMVERVVARHVGPLREQLDASGDRIRFRDILGGLGWIVGVTGIACWFRARRGRRRRSQ